MLNWHDIKIIPLYISSTIIALYIICPIFNINLIAQESFSFKKLIFTTVAVEAAAIGLTYLARHELLGICVEKNYPKTAQLLIRYLGANATVKNITEKKRTGFNALEIARRNNHTTFNKVLNTVIISKNQRINQQQDTPLSIDEELKNENFDKALKLQKNGNIINLEIHSKTIIECAEIKNEKQLELWLQFNGVEKVKNKNGDTLLHYACTNNWIDLCKILLNKMTLQQIDSHNIQHYTALHLAALKKHEDICVLLQKANATIIYEDKHEITLPEKNERLFKAINNGDQKKVLFYLLVGANKTIYQIKQNHDPLIMAVKKLVKLKKQISQENKEKLDKEKKEQSNIQEQNYRLIIQHLKKYGPSLNQDTIDKKLFDAAINKKDRYTILYYLLLGANPYRLFNFTHEKDGSSTALHEAIKNKKLESLRYILEENSGNIDTLDSNGTTPLLLALELDDNSLLISCGIYHKCAELLLEKGASIHVKNKKNKIIFEKYIKKNSLFSEFLNKIKTKAFNIKHFEESIKKRNINEECPICFNLYTKQQNINVLNCGHLVCTDCKIEICHTCGKPC